MKQTTLLLSHLSLVVGSLLLAACNGSFSGAPNVTAPNLVSGTGHLVGANPATHSEMNELGNNSKAGAENTNYTLSPSGMIISGNIESSGTPTTDFYKFNTGGFSYVNVQVFIDGQALDLTTTQTYLNLSTFTFIGLSDLLGGGGFVRASIQPTTDYVIAITPSSALAGRSYTIELVGTTSQH